MRSEQRYFGREISYLANVIYNLPETVLRQVKGITDCFDNYH